MAGPCHTACYAMFRLHLAIAHGASHRKFTQQSVLRVGKRRPVAHRTGIKSGCDDVEEHRRQENAEQRDADHSRENGRAERAAHFCSGPVAAS